MSGYQLVTRDRLRAVLPPNITDEQLAEGERLLADDRGVRSSAQRWRRLLTFFEEVVRLPHFVDPPASTVRFGETSFVVNELEVWMGQGELVEHELLTRIVELVRAAKKISTQELSNRLGISESALTPHVDHLQARGAIRLLTGDSSVTVCAGARTAAWLRARRPQPRDPR